MDKWNPLTDQTAILDDIATLYELSLDIGTSLDLEKNCETFFRKLMARRNWSFCGLFIHDSKFGGSEDVYKCAYAAPVVSAEIAVLPGNCPTINKIIEENAASVPAMSNPKLAAMASLGRSVDGAGIAVAFALECKAVLIGISHVRTEPYCDWELNQFRLLAGKFSSSIEACLAHSSLAAEISQRIELQKRLARAERMESVGVLAGGVAHDLGNIMHPIIWSSSILMHELPEGSPLHADAARIEKAGLQAREILGDLTALARMSVSHHEDIDASAVVRAYAEGPSISELQQRFPDVALCTEIACDCTIKGSETAITRILLNLVSNAFDATEGQGQVAISLSHHCFEKAVAGYETVPPGTYCQLAVSDQGKGIHIDPIDVIFEPFYSSKGEGRTGSGLGLAIVHGFVKELGGFIDVETSSNGTRFVLSFPVHLDGQGETGLDQQGRRILVVDDDAEQAKAVCAMLEAKGFQVSFAMNGDEAMAQAARQLPNLVIMDVMLGGEDGVNVFQSIKAANPSSKCLLASAYAPADALERGAEIGVTSLLRKPYNAEELMRAIRSLS